MDNYVVEEDKKSVTNFYNRAYITEKLKGLETELRQDCRIVLDGEERWVSNVVMRGEIEDSEYAMIFLRDITESKAETARRMQMASDNASMDLLIKSMVRLLDRFVVCDLENDRYRFYNLQGDMIYAPTGLTMILWSRWLQGIRHWSRWTAIGCFDFTGKYPKESAGRERHLQI